MTLGKLYLVPTPLDFGCETQIPLENTLPEQTIQAASNLHYWVAENAKSTRSFLKRVHEKIPLSHPIQAQQIKELDRLVHKKGDFAHPFDASLFLSPLKDGCDVGLICEAGMPAIADPGSLVVRGAHQMGANVVPLVGPCSILLTLAASGLNGQSFSFVGYVPTQESERIERLKQLEKLSKEGQTQLFIETPYRNESLLKTLLSTLHTSTFLVAACGLTLENEQIISGKISTWHDQKWKVPAKLPTVFALGK